MKKISHSNKKDVNDQHLAILFSKLYDSYLPFDPYDGTSFTDYKKSILKLIDTIKASIAQSIENTDNYHSSELNEHIKNCKSLIKESKSIHVINTAMISFQAKLIFCLLGHTPDNFGMGKVTNQSPNWRLDAYRKINYTQSRKQKIYLLRTLLQKEYFKNELADYYKTMDKYRREKNKGEDLFDWFKRVHPLLYFQVFDIDKKGY